MTNIEKMTAIISRMGEQFVPDDLRDQVENERRRADAVRIKVFTDAVTALVNTIKDLISTIGITATITEERGWIEIRFSDCFGIIIDYDPETKESAMTHICMSGIDIHIMEITTARDSDGDGWKTVVAWVSHGPATNDSGIDEIFNNKNEDPYHRAIAKYINDKLYETYETCIQSKVSLWF